MRWDDLFRDLEAQLEAAEAVDLAAEVADRTRIESAQLALVDRLRGTLGRRVTVRVVAAGLVDGELQGVGPDWLLIAGPGGREAVVSLPAVVSVSGLAGWSAAPGETGEVTRRLGLGYALRGLARDRAGVSVTLLDGTVLTGTLDRVGADFVELAGHGPGEARRRDEVRSVPALPLRALAVVRRSL